MSSNETTKPTEFVSPITNKTYHVYDVSPLLFGMITSDTVESKETNELRLKIATLASSIKEDTEVLGRQDVDEKLRAEITKRRDESVKSLRDGQMQLASLLKIKPATICAVVRAFVKGFEKMSDQEMIRYGKDLDMLYVIVESKANEDSEKYSNMIKFFRTPQRASDSPSAQG